MTGNKIQVAGGPENSTHPKKPRTIVYYLHIPIGPHEMSLTDVGPYKLSNIFGPIPLFPQIPFPLFVFPGF